jgi:hypothetical protein
MAAETAAMYVSAAGAAVTSAAAVAAAKWVHDTRQTATKALALLEGHDEVEGDGLIDRQQEHREALRNADLLPPSRAERLRERRRARHDRDEEGRHA